tara:strand:- start:43 stop:150 length:108 start_codon:yes stop_codon:yes gene_type:complete
MNDKQKLKYKQIAYEINSENSSLAEEIEKVDKRIK